MRNTLTLNSLISSTVLIWTIRILLQYQKLISCTDQSSLVPRERIFCIHDTLAFETHTTHPHAVCTKERCQGEQVVHQNRPLNSLGFADGKINSIVLKKWNKNMVGVSLELELEWSVNAWINDLRVWLTRDGKKACTMVSFSTLSRAEKVPWAPAGKKQFCSLSWPRFATITLFEVELSGMIMTGAPASISSRTLVARWGWSLICKRYKTEARQKFRGFSVFSRNSQ